MLRRMVFGVATVVAITTAVVTRVTAAYAVSQSRLPNKATALGDSLCAVLRVLCGRRLAGCRLCRWLLASS
eukprot:COSAG01_NODE_28770_length_653_cov_0.915162_1_plen_71_part_00